MPIRFRCAYCNQLMGIARRKAGTVVKCPTCSGQVVVPQNDMEGTDREPQGSPAPAAKQAQPNLLENSDFNKMFEEPPPIDPVTASPSASAPTHSPPSPPAAPVYSEGHRSDSSASSIEAVPQGILLSPAKATILTVVAILLLAVAFGVGVLVGRFVLS